MKLHPNFMGSLCKTLCEYWCIKLYRIKDSYWGIFLSQGKMSIWASYSSNIWSHLCPPLIQELLPFPGCLSLPHGRETLGRKYCNSCWETGRAVTILNKGRKKASKHHKTYTEFSIFCQLYELGNDYRLLHIWHCFLFIFHLLLTLQTSQSGIPGIKVKILYNAVVLCLYRQTSWIYLLRAQKPWKTKFRAATHWISPWLQCLNFYTHVNYAFIERERERYSPITFEKLQ